MGPPHAVGSVAIEKAGKAELKKTLDQIDSAPEERMRGITIGLSPVLAADNTSPNPSPNSSVTQVPPANDPAGGNAPGSANSSRAIVMYLSCPCSTLEMQ